MASEEFGITGVKGFTAKHLETIMKLTFITSEKYLKVKVRECVLNLKATKKQKTEFGLQNFKNVSFKLSHIRI